MTPRGRGPREDALSTLHPKLFWVKNRDGHGMTLEAIKYGGGKLTILNQLLLPSQSVYLELRTVEDAWEAIRAMKV